MRMDARWSDIGVDRWSFQVRNQHCKSIERVDWGDKGRYFLIVRWKHARCESKHDGKRAEQGPFLVLSKRKTEKWGEMGKISRKSSRASNLEEIRESRGSFFASPLKVRESVQFHGYEGRKCAKSWNNEAFSHEMTKKKDRCRHVSSQCVCFNMSGNSDESEQKNE